MSTGAPEESFEGSAGGQATEVVVQLPGNLAGALAAIGVALDFPQYYGHNLDALLDCLRDLDAPVVLRLDGWQELAWRDPSGWARLREVLADRIAEGGLRPNPALAPVPGFGIRRG